MTQPSEHNGKAADVKATWGKRCNILYFVSTQEDENLPAIALEGEESYKLAWQKTRLQISLAIRGGFVP